MWQRYFCEKVSTFHASVQASANQIVFPQLESAKQIVHGDEGAPVVEEMPK